MKPIVFNDGTEDITIGLSFSDSFVIIGDDDGETYVNVEHIDKLIEALHLIKKELNLE